MKDPIVEEVRKARLQFAAKYNFDLKAIFTELRRQQKKSGRKVVSFANKKKQLLAA